MGFPCFKSHKGKEGLVQRKDTMEFFFFFFLCIIVCGYMIVCVLLFRARLYVHLRASRSMSSHDARAAVQAVERGTLCKSQERG